MRSLRKTKRLWDAKTESWIVRSNYELPEDLTEAAVKAGITELLRPCSPGITALFVKLHATKPVYDADQQGLKLRWDGLYDDLQQYPEVAVVLALDDLRKTEGKFFPTNHEIIKEVSEYRDLIYDVVDYFKGEADVQ